LLTSQPVDDGYKRKHDAYPIHGGSNWIYDMLEGPLEAIGYRLKDALEVHG
jgi:hypothetical protein